LLRPWIAKAEAEMDEVVGHTTVNLGRGDAGSNLVGNLVTDAMRSFFSADAAFQNLGGLRADIPSGDIRARDVFNVLPFGNELVVVRMTGAMLRRVVERKLAGGSGGICVSGVEVAYDGDRPDYDKVVSFTVGGAPLDHDGTYRVVLSSFLLAGNSGLDFLTTIPEENVELTQITTAEALTRYLREHDPVRPTVDGRWVERRGAPQQAYLATPYLP
jgi:2',3'-cyclic-nucleotide 2'-phosphodiesterase (5'-nucleotidase family)